LHHSTALPDDVRARTARLAGRRLRNDGVVVITTRRPRTQERNRADALDRLVDWLLRAARPPAPRKATRPSAGVTQLWLATKSRRGALKKKRGVVVGED